MFAFHLAFALAETPIDVSVPKGTIPGGVGTYVHACAETGVLVNGMYDLRPVAGWLVDGVDPASGRNWWHDVTVVSDPLDRPAVQAALLTRFVDVFNRPGYGPSASSVDSSNPASALEVVHSHGVDLIRPTNTWHPAHADAAGSVPTTGGPAALWPDRCTLTAPVTGRLTVAEALEACRVSTPLDTASTVPPARGLTGYGVAIPPGTMLTLTDVLQRVSGEHGIQWEYTCAVLPPVDRDAPASSPDSRSFEECQLVLNRKAAVREGGRRRIDFAITNHGPSNCPSRRSPG